MCTESVDDEIIIILKTQGLGMSIRGTQAQGLYIFCTSNDVDSDKSYFPFGLISALQTDPQRRQHGPHQLSPAGRAIWNDRHRGVALLSFLCSLHKI